MAYDEQLAARVRACLEDRPDVVEKKMFGGLCFMVRGSMACGVLKDDLIVKVGKQGHEAALARPHTRVMDFTGRPMIGMVYVAPEGSRGAQLGKWVAIACAQAEARAAAERAAPAKPKPE